ncbi:hypothetical protein B7G54_25755 [Burkholderia puraquae]|uniref:Uncharacterized protein n=1 Tax=Burkholderia puraquae TaxID=1904757 RepID=A0A1X1PBE2_9BURK|nr:hypothetical protein B7G54_25755 [Burkholderia puraquae]
MAPPETQNRRVLHDAGGTICGAPRGPGRRGPSARVCTRLHASAHRAFIVVAFRRQERPGRRPASARPAHSRAPIEPAGVDPAQAAQAARKQANRPIRAATALAE